MNQRQALAAIRALNTDTVILFPLDGSATSEVNILGGLRQVSHDFFTLRAFSGPSTEITEICTKLGALAEYSDELRPYTECSELNAQELNRIKTCLTGISRAITEQLPRINMKNLSQIVSPVYGNPVPPTSAGAKHLNALMNNSELVSTSYIRVVGDYITVNAAPTV